jgi:hypothetical protein
MIAQDGFLFDCPLTFIVMFIVLGLMGLRFGSSYRLTLLNRVSFPGALVVGRHGFF